MFPTTFCCRKRQFVLYCLTTLSPYFFLSASLSLSQWNLILETVPLHMKLNNRVADDKTQEANITTQDAMLISVKVLKCSTYLCVITNWYSGTCLPLLILGKLY